MSTSELTNLELLGRGRIEMRGRMPWSSNATFLVELCAPDQLDAPARRGLAIYKPHRGERPLWDFPDGLHKREVAAFLLSEALGWHIVPATVLRDDAPLGPGSLQRFVKADFEQHYYTLYEDEGARFLDALRRICVFDLLSNQTDRKSGHCLLGAEGPDAGRVYAIDNGLSFHCEFKLRTVIWEFGGERIPSSLLEDVADLLDAGLPDGLAALLDPFERDALLARARAVLSEGVFPIDGTGRRYPWPLI